MPNRCRTLPANYKLFVLPLLLFYEHVKMNFDSHLGIFRVAYGYRVEVGGGGGGAAKKLYIYQTWLQAS